MPSNQEKPDLDSLIDSQKELFGAIRAANAETLRTPIGDEYESIEDKVRARMRLADDAPIELDVNSGLTEDNAERVWVFATAPSQETPTVTPIPVGHIFEGMIFPEVGSGFVAEEVAAIHGMVTGLEQAKKLGALTHLNDTMTEIDDPRRVIMLPPLEDRHLDP